MWMPPSRAPTRWLVSYASYRLKGGRVVYANVVVEGSTTRITDEKGEVSQRAKGSPCE